jgi:hypothetical protein
MILSTKHFRFNHFQRRIKVEEHAREVIDFLRDKADEANALHEKYTKEYEIWCRTRRGKKPIPPVALPIAAQYMRNAAKSLEMALTEATRQSGPRCRCGRLIEDHGLMGGDSHPSKETELRKELATLEKRLVEIRNQLGSNHG